MEENNTVAREEEQSEKSVLMKPASTTMFVAINIALNILIGFAFFVVTGWMATLSKNCSELTTRMHFTLPVPLKLSLGAADFINNHLGTCGLGLLAFALYAVLQVFSLVFLKAAKKDMVRTLLLQMALLIAGGFFVTILVAIFASCIHAVLDIIPISSL